MDQNEINDCVSRGAAALDAREDAGGWLDRIDLDELNIASADRCVLGQTYAGGHSCCGWCGAPYELKDEAEVLGFDGKSVDLWATEDAWARLIAARRSQRVQQLTEDGWLLSRDSLSLISPATGGIADALHDGAYTLPEQRVAEIMGDKPTA